MTEQTNSRETTNANWFSVFALALVFALVFMTFSNQFSLPGFVVGYLLSMGVLTLGQAYRLRFKPRQVLTQVMYLLLYTFRLAVDIFLSSVQVARLVLSPNLRDNMNPGVRKISTQDETHNEIITAMSSHGITITPGQMVIDIDYEDGRTVLYVHNLDLDFAEELQAEQTERLRLIRKILGYG